MCAVKIISVLFLYGQWIHINTTLKFLFFSVIWLSEIIHVLFFSVSKKSFKLTVSWSSEINIFGQLLSSERKYGNRCSNILFAIVFAVKSKLLANWCLTQDKVITVFSSKDWSTSSNLSLEIIALLFTLWGLNLKKNSLFFLLTLSPNILSIFTFSNTFKVVKRPYHFPQFAKLLSVKGSSNALVFSLLNQIPLSMILNDLIFCWEASHTSKARAHCSGALSTSILISQSWIHFSCIELILFTTHSNNGVYSFTFGFNPTMVSMLVAIPTHSIINGHTIYKKARNSIEYYLHHHLFHSPSQIPYALSIYSIRIKDLICFLMPKCQSDALRN